MAAQPDFDKLTKYSAWMDTFHKDIVHFHGSPNVTITEDNKLFLGFKPFRENRTELEEGKMYLTIRCGLCGIYSCLNQWKGGRWGMKCLDGSSTIAYRELKEEEKYNDSERID
jgi:hypothetical protein